MRAHAALATALTLAIAPACEKAHDPPQTSASASQATALTSARVNDAVPALSRISRASLVVTHGAITDGASGSISIRDPEVRAVAPQTSPNDATLRFTYRGPTDKTAPLASGEVRRQVGLKLRAENGCNLVYVMWRFEPKEELVVSVKTNPGQRTHAECGAHGYRNVAGEVRAHLPPIAPGDTHTLSAHVDGDHLAVSVDQDAQLHYVLDGTSALVGPVGFRTDNANVDLEMLATPGIPAQIAPEDE